MKLPSNQSTVSLLKLVPGMADRKRGSRAGATAFAAGEAALVPVQVPPPAHRRGHLWEEVGHPHGPRWHQVRSSQQQASHRTLTLERAVVAHQTDTCAAHFLLKSTCTASAAICQ